MKALVIAFVMALVLVPLAVLAWHRPDPKHTLIFSLIEDLASKLPDLPGSAAAPRGGAERG